MLEVTEPAIRVPSGSDLGYSVAGERRRNAEAAEGLTGRELGQIQFELHGEDNIPPYSEIP